MNDRKSTNTTTGNSNSNIFTVRSKPRTSSSTSSSPLRGATYEYVIQFMNLIVAILINVTILRVLNYLAIYWNLNLNSGGGIGETEAEGGSTGDNGAGIGIGIGKITSFYTFRLLSSPTSLPSSSWEVTILIVLYNIITMVQLALWMRGNRNRNMIQTQTQTQNVCQVEIVPNLGIQIRQYKCTRTKLINTDIHMNIGEDKEETEIRKNEKVQFIPMENIVDVIVSEVIMSYKVRNCVMIRVKKKNKNKKSDMKSISNSNDNDNGSGNDLNGNLNVNVMASGDVSLIPAFSTKMVEMSYRECFHVWQGISQALTLTYRQT